jgi:hypothetical protein
MVIAIGKRRSALWAAAVCRWQCPLHSHSGTRGAKRVRRVHRPGCDARGYWRPGYGSAAGNRTHCPVATGVAVLAGAGHLVWQIYPKRGMPVAAMPVMFGERAVSKPGGIKDDVATNEGERVLCLTPVLNRRVQVGGVCVGMHFFAKRWVCGGAGTGS